MGMYDFFLVVFRLVVFRPFTSEVVMAKVKSSDEDGIRRVLLFQLFCMSIKVLTRPFFPVTVGFFDDIYIPTAYLPQPSALYVLVIQTSSIFKKNLNKSTSDPNERCHFWIPESTLTTSTELLDTPL